MFIDVSDGKLGIYSSSSGSNNGYMLCNSINGSNKMSGNNCYEFNK